MEECSNLGALVPMAVKEKEDTAKIEANKENDHKKEQPAEEGNSLTEKAKEALNSAADKTKEMVHHMKEKLTDIVDGENKHQGSDTTREGVRSENASDTIHHMPEPIDNEDLFTRKERETHGTLDGEAMQFSQTDELHAEQAQKIAFVHAKQD
uniref:Uncharacterized protein n=1 Tax=Plectus sambesii TaxID=2011161 RepID=A0A914UN55_9BILA